MFLFWIAVAILYGIGEELWLSYDARKNPPPPFTEGTQQVLRQIEQRERERRNNYRR